MGSDIYIRDPIRIPTRLPIRGPIEGSEIRHPFTASDPASDLGIPAGRDRDWAALGCFGPHRVGCGGIQAAYRSIGLKWVALGRIRLQWTSQPAQVPKKEDADK